MKSRFRKLGVESLEGRKVLSTTAFPDFNNDGLQDVAAITSPNTITVSLAKPDGSFVVSAILTTPKNQPISYISVVDVDGDGNLDVYANSSANGGAYVHTWLGNGDGMFDSRTTEKWRWPYGHVGHGGTW